MSNYRRARVPGAIYFFTVNLRDRHSDLLEQRGSLYLHGGKSLREFSTLRRAELRAAASAPHHGPCATHRLRLA